MSSRQRATSWGALAIVLWSTLAAASLLVTAIPPLQLMAMTFGVASLLSLLKWTARRESIASHLRQPLGAWLVGCGGLFGYHLLYFLALRMAPPAEANVVNYLWPMFIILFAKALPGETLRARHVFGAAISFLGTALVVTHGAVAFSRGSAAGYAAALGCAVVWAGYSVASRRFSQVPSDAVGGYCAVTAFLSAILHLALEPTVLPTAGVTTIIVLLGIGPLGLSFFLWDVGMKHGDPRTLGALSYVGQVASTLLLVAIGRAPLSAALALGALMVTAGAAIGTSDAWSRAVTPTSPAAGQQVTKRHQA